MLKADEAKFILKSTTPLNCVAALRFVIATKAGTCRINVAKRSNGFVLQTFTMKVAATGVTGVDVVAVAEPLTVYFTGGTSNFRASAAKTIKAAASAAKNANVVFVGGYTGNATTDVVNKTLAGARAAKTRDALRGAGVTATVAVWSFGSAGAVSKGKSAAEQNLNRRAVIYIVP
jgi:outer membrane protein OmpA-like peptidoglycan-associated protein